MTRPAKFLVTGVGGFTGTACEFTRLAPGGPEAGWWKTAWPGTRGWPRPARAPVETPQEAGGFAGSPLAGRRVRLGHEVRCLVRRTGPPAACMGAARVLPPAGTV